MNRNLVCPPVAGSIVARAFLCLFAAYALPALAQPQEEQQSLGSDAGPSLLRPISSIPSNAPNPACDPSDLQSGECAGVTAGATAPMETRDPYQNRSKELPRDTNPERFPKPKSVEDSQFEKIVDPPTEFQKFVELSTGKSLPLYGAALFNRVPSTYAPVDRVPVANDYLIGPGDELDVRVWGQINFEQRLTVDRTGDIFIPQVGRIGVANLPYGELPKALKVSIGRVFRNFEVSVSMGQLRSMQVFVLGHARRPGTYTLSSLSTLVNALFISGGPSPQGSMRNIELKRAGQTVTRFDLYDLLLQGDKTKDAPLKAGDVIFIPAAGPRVAVSGSVEVPAIYEIQPKSSLREVLADAGGLSPMAAGQRALIDRIDDRAALISNSVSLNENGLETPVQNGDIIRVLDLVPSFKRTVSLKGNVADAIRMPWHDGMRVSDLIPEKQALLTRGYWTEHNRLAAAGTGYADEIDTNSDTSLAGAISENSSIKRRKFSQRNDLQPPAPDINWNYAAIERIDDRTLSTRVIPFNLGKAVLERDESANLPLQPGDVVNVFSLADFATPLAEQSRIVRLEGEVKMAGIYSVQPGETLRQLLRRAGGLTDKAYLYAANFTRESTKREQQQRLNDYLDQAEKDLEQNSAALSARTISAEQQASSRLDIQRQHEAIARLRARQSTGRIVFDLKPDSINIDDLPDLALQNGDRLLVPSAPATVSVMGTVYNQSAFLYEPDSSVRDYLKRSGGPTKYADASQMFVIRANGSVLSRAKQSHFETIAVRPGDALVVPSNTFKLSLIRNLMDWSQVLSGFGLAAAAVNVLK